MSEAERPEHESIETPEAAEEPAVGGVATPGELEQLRAEKRELEERLLRVSADYQNYAKRSQSNLIVAQQQKVMDIARGLVAALDHFDRALEVDPEKTATADLLQGVTSIKDELLKALQSFGIQRIDVEPGTEFDPVRHEAMLRQPHEDIASGHVVMQLLPGYVVDDRVVRPAQVGVAE